MGVKRYVCDEYAGICEAESPFPCRSIPDNKSQSQARELHPFQRQTKEEQGKKGS